MRLSPSIAAMLGAALCSALAAVPGAMARDALPGPVPARVVGVQDGDTLTVRARIWLDQEVETRVRIAGIDTPESRSDCADERAAARAAKDHLQSLVAAGTETVRLREIEHDKFGGRVRARVELGDGTDLGQAQIRAGHARPYNGEKRRPWCS